MYIGATASYFSSLARLAQMHPQDNFDYLWKGDFIHDCYVVAMANQLVTLEIVRCFGEIGGD